MTSRRAPALAAVLLAAGCRSNAPPAGPPAVESQGAAAPGMAAAELARPEDAGALALEAGMPRLTVVLDDPRLAGARGAAPSDAAHVVEAAEPAAGLDAASACAWWYVAGRLRLQAGDLAEAARDFGSSVAAASAPDPLDAAAARPVTLAPYAALREAEALVRLGRGSEALTVAASLGEDLAARDVGRLVLADAYVAMGDRARAVPVWRSLLAASPRGLRWADTALQLAAALLDGKASDGDAREALDLATRVLVESPSAAEKGDVSGLRDRAARALRLPATPPLTPDEQSRQAQAWQDAGQGKRATSVAEALLASDRKPDAATCAAATVRAQAFPHGRSAGAADAWGVAIARCEGSDALPQALYYGAKASVSAHRHDEALARFGRVERDFPAHRLADDARLRAAMVVKDEGDDARSLAMLTSLPDTYPQGDMGGEALFRAAIDRIAAHDYPVAAALLDRLLAMPDEAKGCCGGRGPYFRARVAQLSGDAAGARERYAAVVATQPLTFYMMLAAARLRAIDPSAAREALRAAADQEPDAPFLAQDHPELASPSFDRFARLLEVGDLDAARREVAIGKLAADGVDPDVLWTVAWAYDRAGAPDLGHAFSRARLVDFRGHWPAGRWRLPWQVAYPRAWDALVTRESAASGIPAPLTWSIMREESAYNPDAKSGAGAIGLMQLMTGTARQMAAGTPLVVDDASLRRPDVSIPLGARLLSKMRASFQANPALAVAAYNSGSGPVRHWLDERGTDDFDLFVERIPYEETRNYVKRVLTSEVAYAYLYAPGALDELLALPARASG